MLYVVATPIGNLEDITKRGVDVLRNVDLIACEDTRHSRILLDRYGVTTRTVSYHQHSSLQKIDWLVEQLIEGQDVALVTDAGTPAVADPGGVLLAAVHERNKSLAEPITIVSVPGPSSITAALSVCGFPADQFLFLGFLPKKKGRQTLLRSLASLDKALGVETVVFFESPQRIHQTLVDIEAAFRNLSLRSANWRRSNLRDRHDLRPRDDQILVCLCRELTKKFEEIWRGTLAEAVEKTKGPQKGEFVVVLHVP